MITEIRFGENREYRAFKGTIGWTIKKPGAHLNDIVEVYPDAFGMLLAIKRLFDAYPPTTEDDQILFQAIIDTIK